MTQLISPLRDLRTLFERSINVRDVAEPLCSFDWDHPAPEVRTFMEQRDYDVVGVRRHGTMVGYVELGDLETGTVGEHNRSFNDSEILSESAPIIAVLTALHGQGWSFVDVLGQVGGIVTRGDLQKAPVRMWLFGLISMLEMHLLRMIREYYPDESWVSKVSDGRLAAAKNILEDRKRRNEAIDLADCLQFADKKTIISKTERLRESLGFESTTHCSKALKRIEDLRNALAHAQDIVGTDWPRLAEVAELTEQLVGRCERVDALGDVLTPVSN